MPSKTSPLTPGSPRIFIVRQLTRRRPPPHPLLAFLGIVLGLGNPASALTVRSIEFQGLNHLNEHIIRPYLTLEVGRHYSPRELDEAVAWSIARAESSPVIDFLIIEDFRDDDGSVHIIIEVIERSFLWTFSGGTLYAEAGRYNLIGPGSLVQAALGYNLQRLRVDRPSAGPIPGGFAGEAGHRILNPYTPRSSRSRLSFEFTPYLNITPFIRLDLSPRFRLYPRRTPGAEPVSEFSIAAALRANYRYLQHRTLPALDARASYRLILHGPGTGTHILDLTALADIRIFPFLHAVPEGYIAFQTRRDTAELLSSGIPGDSNTGPLAWRGTLSIPIRLSSGGRGIQTDFGIAPQIHIGAAGTAFSRTARTLALGGGPYMELGPPVGLRISPEFYCLTAQRRFAFRFVVELSAE